MNILIVANGDVKNYDKIKGELPHTDYIICADGGVKHAVKLGLKPDLIVGDFDSASKSVLQNFKKAGVSVITYSTDKDQTDTQIAVEKAIEKGATNVVFLGALGSRFDHSYANIMLLNRLVKSGITSKIIDEQNVIVMSDKHIELEGVIGQVLSILPFGGNACVAETQGLKYQMQNCVLQLDNPFGVSNVFNLERVSIRVSSGYILAIKAWD